MSTKRFFQTPTPLAFFGFLLTFLLTVAWRVPMQRGSFFGTAEAATLPAAAPMPTPVVAPAPVPVVIPQPIPSVYVAPAMPEAAPAAPVVIPSMTTASLAAAPGDAAEGAVAAPVKKVKGDKARRALRPRPAAAGEDLAGIMSAAAEGHAPKKRSRRE